MLDTTNAIQVHVPAGELHDALKRVRHAMSQEDTRYYLCGAFLHIMDGKLKVATTDGHRLAVVEMPGAADFTGMPGVILSTDAVAAILKSGLSKRRFRFGWSATLAVAPTGVVMAMPEIETVNCGVVEGTFPDYLRVIPRGETQTVTMDREELRKAVAATYGFAQGASDKQAVSLKFDLRESQCTVSVEREEGSAVCKVATVEPVKEPIQIGFNGRYVLDILQSLEGKSVSLGLSDPCSPTRFAGDDSDAHALHVLMPMRI